MKSVTLTARGVSVTVPVSDWRAVVAAVGSRAGSVVLAAATRVIQYRSRIAAHGDALTAQDLALVAQIEQALIRQGGRAMPACYGTGWDVAAV